MTQRRPKPRAETPLRARRPHQRSENAIPPRRRRSPLCSSPKRSGEPATASLRRPIDCCLSLPTGLPGPIACGCSRPSPRRRRRWRACRGSTASRRTARLSCGSSKRKRYGSRTSAARFRGPTRRAIPWESRSMDRMSSGPKKDSQPTTVTVGSRKRALARLDRAAKSSQWVQPARPSRPTPTTSTR